jgi:tetratricopeptide (TPR) repeat protein
MNTGGMMIQWFHLYEMNDDIFKMVVRTFRSSFKYVSIWQPVGGDVILLGLEQPLSVDFSRLQAVIASKGIKEDLQRIHIQDAATLLSLEMLSPESVSRYISIGELNNEDHLQLEYRAPSAFYINRGVGQIAQLDERRNSNSCSLQINKLMETRRLTDEELRNIGFFHTVGPNSNLIFGYSILCEYLKTHSKDIAVLKKVADIAERLKRNVDALNFYKILMELEPRNPEVLGKYAWLKYISDRATVTTLTSFDTKEYENLLHKSIKLVADTLDLYRVRLADIYFGTQQYAKAKDQFARAIQIRESHAGNSKISYDVLLLRLAHCLYLLNENNRAASYAMAAIQVNPQNEEAKDLVYEIFMGGTAQQQSKSDSSSLNRQGKPVR